MSPMSPGLQKSKFSRERDNGNYQAINLNTQNQNDQKLMGSIALDFKKNIYTKALDNIISNTALSSIEELKEKILLEKIKNKLVLAENKSIKALLEKDEERRKKIAEEVKEKSNASTFSSSDDEDDSMISL